MVASRILNYDLKKVLMVDCFAREFYFFEIHSQFFRSAFDSNRLHNSYKSTPKLLPFAPTLNSRFLAKTAIKIDPELSN